MRRPDSATLVSILAVGALIIFAHLAGVVLCPLKRVLGVPCPTCGATRAVFALLHCEFVVAFKTNPLVVSLLALLPFGPFLYRYSRTHRRFRLGVLVALVIAIAANWWYIVRVTG